MKPTPSDVVTANDKTKKKLVTVWRSLSDSLPVLLNFLDLSKCLA